MKNVFLLFVMISFASYCYSQETTEYSLEGLKKAVPLYSDMNFDSCKDGIIIVKRDGKYGCINLKGEEVIPCIYSQIDSFSDGYALVEKTDADNNQLQYFFIDNKGTRYLPFPSDYLSPSVHDGLIIAIDNGKYGYFDVNGRIVIPCIYDYAEEFKDGIAKVELNGKWGLINTKGKFIIPCKYERIMWDFHEGLCILRFNSKCGFVDKKGNNITPFIYDRAEDFKNGFARVKKGNRWGIIDKKGKLVFPCQYKNISLPSDSVAIVSTGHIEIDAGITYEDGTKWVYQYYINDCVNMDGKVILSGLMSLSDFHNGYATVFSIEDGGHAYIDKKGNKITSYLYDVAEAFEGNLACARRKDTKLYGYIDTDGNEAIPFIYTDAKTFSDSIAAVKLNGKWGFINQRGEEFIPIKYDEVYRLGDECIIAVLNENRHLIDKSGKTILITKDYIKEVVKGLYSIYNNRRVSGFINSNGDSTF